MLDFEWDDAKARSNLAKHGVSFVEAKEAFRDPFGLELFDDRFEYDENRFVLIAMTSDRCLTVILRSGYGSGDLGVPRQTNDSYFEARQLRTTVNDPEIAHLRAAELCA